MITRCTITGLNDVGLILQVNGLFREFPFLEIGVPFSETRAGRENRFPSPGDVMAIVQQLEGPVALHVCGRAVENVILGNSQGSANSLARHEKVGRVQLNLNARAKWLPAPDIIDAAIRGFRKPVITQENSANRDLNRQLTAPNHQVLFDSSGGLGIAPECWPKPIPGKACGFAGGLGPQTIAEQIPLIEAAAGGDCAWIDMEGRVRTEDDWLDLEKVAVVLKVVVDHIARPAMNDTRPILRECGRPRAA